MSPAKYITALTLVIAIFLASCRAQIAEDLSRKDPEGPEKMENAAPVSLASNFQVLSKNTVGIVLGATDAEGSVLSYSFTNPAHGELSGIAPNLLYDPADDYEGADSFTFTVNDGEKSSEAATIHIQVVAVCEAVKLVPQQVAAGLYHTCTRDQLGGVKCFGLNEKGQLGLGDNENRGFESDQMGANLPFVHLGEGKLALSIATGREHTCAILNDRSLKCWGRNVFGQLGIDTLVDSNVPQTVVFPAERTVAAIAAGDYHTCAVLDNGSVMCWGKNNSGQVGDNTVVNRKKPTPIASTQFPQGVKTIALGGSHSCAILNNDSVKCWGINDQGQVGVSATNTKVPRPVSLGSGRTASAISLGSAHTCAVLDNASLKCWGYNSSGQLGLGNLVNASVPTLVAVGGEVASVAANGEMTCAGLADKSMKCWGVNTYGQLGLGYNDPDILNTPQAVTTDQQVTAIALGSFHSCALLADSSLKCWGLNNYGQLGQENILFLGDKPETIPSLIPSIRLYE